MKNWYINKIIVVFSEFDLAALVLYFKFFMETKRIGWSGGTADLMSQKGQDNLRMREVKN